MIYAILFVRYRLQQRIRNKPVKDSQKEDGQANCAVKDERTVEELLSFINSDNNAARTQKKKRQNKRRDQTPMQKQDQILSTSSVLEEDPFSEELFLEEERMIDPDFKAKVDREVEEWRAKLEQINMQCQGLPKIKLPITCAIGVK